MNKANGYDLYHMSQTELIHLLEDLGMKQADNGLWFNIKMTYDGNYIVEDKTGHGEIMDKYELKEFMKV